MRRTRSTALILAWLLTTSLALGGTADASAIKLTASDGAAGDQFGNPVAVDGDTLVVGALGDSDLGVRTGAAYVFVRSGSTWVQQARLVASDRAQGDQFGVDVAISGDSVVVGAISHAHGVSLGGSAYVFVRSGSTWTQQAELLAPDRASGDQFGSTVAISSDTVVVGSIFDDDGAFNAGSAYVFVRSGSSWPMRAKLTLPDPAASDYFGGSVAISGNTIVVGSTQDDDLGSNSGSAHVYVGSGGSWARQAELLAPDGALGDAFGGPMAIEGDTLIFGVPRDDVIGYDTGSAYVFTRTGTTWTWQVKLLASDAAEDHEFANSVAISGDSFGIGVERDDTRGNDAGAAYVFVRDGPTWREHEKVLASDGATSDLFGNSVAIDGYTIFVGSPLDDDRGSSSGSVYIEDTTPRPPSPPRDLTVTTTGERANLSWTEPADTGSQPLDGYRVFRTDPRGREVTAAEVPGHQRTLADPRLCAGTYTYRVTAFSDAGESPSSNTVQAGITSQLPCPPEGVHTVRGLAPRSVRLSWSAPPGTVLPESYRVFKGTSPDTGTTAIANIPHRPDGSQDFVYNATQYEVGTLVYFRVTALARAGESARSEPAFGIPAPEGTGPPTAPYLTLVGTSSAGVSLAWQAPAPDDPPFDRYLVHRGNRPSDTGAPGGGLDDVLDEGSSIIAEVNAATTQYLDPLPCSTDQYYRVSAVSAAGNSYPSNEVRATWVGPLGPCPPHDLTATALPPGGGVELRWQAEPPLPGREFRLHYAAGSASGSFGVVPDIDGGGFRFIHAVGQGIENATITYRVGALSGDLESGLSNEATATIGPSTAQVDYWAIGDSIVSGHGLTPYSDDGCKRSDRAYPRLVNDVLSNDGSVRPWLGSSQNLGCSGASTGPSGAPGPTPIVDQADEAAQLIGLAQGEAWVSTDGGANNFNFASGGTGEHLLCDDTSQFRGWVNGILSDVEHDFLGPQLDLQGASILGSLLDAGNTTVVVQGIYAPIERMAGPAVSPGPLFGQAPTDDRHPLHHAWDSGLTEDCLYDTHYTGGFLGIYLYDEDEGIHDRALRRVEWAVYQLNLRLQQVAARAHTLRPGLLADRVRFVAPAETFRGRVACNLFAGDSLVQEFSYAPAIAGDGHDCVHPSGSNGDGEVNRGAEVLRDLVIEGLQETRDSDRWHVDPNGSPPLT